MNILLIAPLSRFKTCISKNRVQLIKFLSSYNNIFFYDDVPNNNFNQYMLYLNKKNIKIDIVLYYLLYNTKDTYSVNKTFLKNYPLKKKVCFIEDFHYTDDYEDFIKKYNFDLLLLPVHQKKLIGEFKLLYNIDIDVWGFYHDTRLFRPMIAKKEYDVLLYGCLHQKIYPLRYKISIVLKFLKKKYKILVVPFNGYTQKGRSNYHLLPQLIVKSKYVIATSSIYDMFVKKYQEILLCGSKIIGDIPTGYEDTLKGHIKVIEKDDGYQTIFNKIVKYLDEDYEFTDIDQTFKFQKKYGFKKSYKHLINILS